MEKYFNNKKLAEILFNMSVDLSDIVEEDNDIEILEKELEKIEDSYLYIYLQKIAIMNN